MYRPDAEPSVQLTLFPAGLENFRDDALAAKWDIIRNVRRVVTGALELERAAKNIGSSLEASPLVYVSDKKIFDTAFRNGTLQGAYLMVAARMLGLDTGAMSGFDNDVVDKAFFAENGWRSNFLCNIGRLDERPFSTDRPSTMA